MNKEIQYAYKLNWTVVFPNAPNRYSLHACTKARPAVFPVAPCNLRPRSRQNVPSRSTPSTVVELGFFFFFFTFSPPHFDTGIFADSRQPIHRFSNIQDQLDPWPRASCVQVIRKSTLIVLCILCRIKCKAESRGYAPRRKVTTHHGLTYLP